MSQAEDHEGTRRDFLYYATGGAGAVAVGAAVWPLVDQMNPSADVQALSSIRVDVGDIEPGTQLTVKWLGKPVFIRRRTEDEIADARAVEVADLPDGDSRNENLASASAEDSTRALDDAGEWLVMMGLVTSVVGSARATVRTTIRLGGSAKVPPLRICRFRQLNSWTKQRSNWVKGERNVGNSSRPLRTKDRRGEVAS